LCGRFKISSFATNTYSPDVSVDSFCKTSDLRSRFALFRITALPTFFDATKPIFIFGEDLKKATNE